MATGLAPITLADAGPLMAKAMGFSWDTDRREVVEYLNKFRLLLFTDYDKFKLFDDSFHCLCVQTFASECGDPYQGFTLPADILGVEAVYSYGVPLKIRSRWRESHTGIGVSDLGRIEAVQLAETFATERDLVKLSKLKVFTEHENDNNKTIYLEVIDASHKQKRIAFKLVSDGFSVLPVTIRKILSVSMPSGRTGSIKLMQDDGYELSEYTPWESVPTYRRMKVKSWECPSTVVVQGTKKFTNIYFDHDIVEVGNQLIIEAAGRYFKYGETTIETKEIQRSQYDRAEMERLLKGEIARHRGNAIQDGSPFKGAAKLTKNKTLPGYHR